VYSILSEHQHAEARDKGSHAEHDRDQCSLCFPVQVVFAHDGPLPVKIRA
jgi:hypothetical protein